MPVTGYAPGAYDLFHVGHLNLLRRARALCDVLVAGVVADDILRARRGHAPFVPLAERLEVVAAVGLVDAVHAETTPDKADAWRAVGFDLLFKGDDWRGTSRGRALEDHLAPLGVEVVYFPYTMHTSSTQLRRAIEAVGGGDAEPLALS